MKIILGVDLDSNHVAALDLIRELDFPKPRLTLVHVANPIQTFNPAVGVDIGINGEYLNVIENLGRAALDKAMQEACDRDLETQRQFFVGSPAAMLIEEADQVGADLVAVGAGQVGQWAHSFLGSVSRGLAIGCSKSVLVAKPNRQLNHPLKVVFASDFSSFAQHAFEKFLSWKPRGVSEVHLVTAYEISEQEANVLQKNLPMIGGMVEPFIVSQIEESCAQAERAIVAAGYSAYHRVVPGPANDVIKEAMHDIGADLLVVGAQGHGFIERLLVGSTSLHQVVSESYPVLLMRS